MDVTVRMGVRRDEESVVWVEVLLKVERDAWTMSVRGAGRWERNAYLSTLVIRPRRPEDMIG
jgi:hypothetical protein